MTFALIGRHGATIPGALQASGRLTETGFVSADTLRNDTAACDALVVPLADAVASRLARERLAWPVVIDGLLAFYEQVARVPTLPRPLEGAKFPAT